MAGCHASVRRPAAGLVLILLAVCGGLRRRRILWIINKIEMGVHLFTSANERAPL